MRPLDWVAATVLVLQLPIPVFWLVVHPLVGFWRRHGAAYALAAPPAWGGVALFLHAFHERLFTSARAPGWAIALGLGLIAADGYILCRVERELGASRLVGQAELKGSGELATEGLYARMRHPRYTGMMCSVLGACLIAGSLMLWATAAVWWLLVLAAVGLEERELRVRFGTAYDGYSRRVPRFLPFRLWVRGG